MTANEVLEKVRRLNKTEREEFLRKLLSSKEFSEISEDIEDILVEIARRHEPVEPAEKVFQRIDRTRNGA